MVAVQEHSCRRSTGCQSLNVLGFRHVPDMWCPVCGGAGMYTISALIGGEHMTGSPAEVEASTAQAHAPHCEVVGAPLTLRTAAGA